MRHQFLKETEQTAEQYQLSDEIEQTEEHAETIRKAWDAWADFNRLFHQLSPPTEVVQAWDAIRPWLEREGVNTTECLTELYDRLEE